MRRPWIVVKTNSPDETKGEIEGHLEHCQIEVTDKAPANYDLVIKLKCEKSKRNKHVIANLIETFCNVIARVW